MAKPVNLVTDTETLALAMGSDLTTFNTGVYEGTNIRIRQLTGSEQVTILGTTAGARVVSPETWISDRFGAIGARQIKRLLDKGNQ